MKKYLPLIAIALWPAVLFSQHAADQWHFGVLAGISFQTGSATALYGGQINTNEGSSSVSDEDGNLLLYTDGITVWNRNHEIMPNGTGLMGGISTTQSALVVPLPGTVSTYYIFTLDEIGGPNGFRYSIADMTLDGGLGDITTKNVPIKTPVTEKQVAGIHSNGEDYWIVVHEYGTNAFCSYLLTASGLNTTPVVSQTGIVHNNDAFQNTYGQMKFNTCEDRLAVAAGYLDTVEIFQFDPSTGMVSNPVTLPMSDHVYGTEFSPDGNKLYVSCYDAAGTLLQFDLSSGDPVTILNSQTVLSTLDQTYGLQRGPDYRIYVCHAWSSYLGVINAPDLLGTSCNYEENGFNIDPNGMGVTTSLGLPGFVQSYFAGKTSCVPTAAGSPVPDEDAVYPNPARDGFYLNTSGNSQDLHIRIYDISGKLMESFQYSGERFGSAWPSGTFLASVTGPTGTRLTLLVKQ